MSNEVSVEKVWFSFNSKPENHGFNIKQPPQGCGGCSAPPPPACARIWIGQLHIIRPYFRHSVYFEVENIIGEYISLLIMLCNSITNHRTKNNLSTPHGSK